MDEDPPLLNSITLAILAGGAGSRMGMPKGNLVIEGCPILAYLLDRFAWPGPTLLVTAPGREHPPACERFTAEAIDPVANLGPLRGILTAIESSASEVVIVTSVDMPGVGRDHLEFLAGAIRDQPELAGLMLRRIAPSDQRIEPFPGIYRRSTAAEVIGARLIHGQGSVHGLLDDPHFAAIHAPTHWAEGVWTNLNNANDLELFLKSH